jgi:hypothetical protein
MEKSTPPVSNSMARDRRLGSQLILMVRALIEQGIYQGISRWRFGRRSAKRAVFSKRNVKITTAAAMMNRSSAQKRSAETLFAAVAMVPVVPVFRRFNVQAS